MLKNMNPGQLFHELDFTKLEKFWKNNVVVKDFSVLYINNPRCPWKSILSVRSILAIHTLEIFLNRQTEKWPTKFYF